MITTELLVLSQENFKIIQDILEKNNYELKKRDDSSNINEITTPILVDGSSKSQIYLGENKIKGEEVAVKISKINRKQTEDKTIQLQQLDIIMNLDFIAQVYDSFILEDEKLLIQITEYCSKNLECEITDMRNKNEEYSIDQITNIMLNLINALCELHVNKITHYGIKPSNILITKDGIYKLSNPYSNNRFQLDISDEVNPDLYQSPEQQDKKQQYSSEAEKSIIISNSTDVYSMGICFLQLLGINLDSKIVASLHQNDFSVIDSVVKVEHKNFYSFIKFFMLQRDNTRRYQSTMLRKQFIRYFIHIFSQEAEADRIKIQISFFEKDKLKSNQLYLAYLYYFLSQTYEEHTDISLINKSLLILEDLNLIGTEEQALFLEHSCKIALFANKFNLAKMSITQSHDILTKLYKNNDFQFVYSIFSLAYFYVYSNEDKQKSFEYASSSYDLLKQLYGQQHPDIAESLSLLGNAAKFKISEQEGLSFQKQALEMQEQIYSGIHPDLSISYNNLGMAFTNLKYMDQAIQYLRKALQIRQSLYKRSHPRLGNTLACIGFHYEEKRNLELSISYWQQCLKVRQELYKGNNHISIYTTTKKISDLLEEKCQYDQCVGFLKQGIQVLDNIGLSKGEQKADTLKLISQLYTKLNQAALSLIYAKLAFQIVQQQEKSNNLQFSYQLGNLADSYLYTGRINKAYLVLSKNKNKNILFSDYSIKRLKKQI